MAFTAKGNFKAQTPTITVVVTIEKQQINVLKAVIQAYNNDFPSEVLRKLLADIHKQLP